MMLNKSRKALIRASVVGLAAVGLSGCTMYGDGLYGGGGYYGDGYYDDGYGYDGYGYDGYYDPYYDDYRMGYPNMGYGGGWYNNYYYPGYGLYIYDRFGQYWLMNDYYRNYWGGWRDDWRYRHGRGHGRDRDNDRRTERGPGFFKLPRPTEGAAPTMRMRPEQIRREAAPIARMPDGSQGRVTPMTRPDRSERGGQGGFFRMPRPVDGAAAPQGEVRQRRAIPRALPTADPATAEPAAGQPPVRGERRGGFFRTPRPDGSGSEGGPIRERQWQPPREVAPAPQRERPAPAPRAEQPSRSNGGFFKMPRSTGSMKQPEQ